MPHLALPIVANRTIRIKHSRYSATNLLLLLCYVVLSKLQYQARRTRQSHLSLLATMDSRVLSNTAYVPVVTAAVNLVISFWREHAVRICVAMSSNVWFNSMG